MADANAISKQFVDYYYATFDGGDRSQLAGLYRPQSMLSFEGEQIFGTELIKDKLVGLPFQTVKHVVTTLDAQPSLSDQSLLVMVTGLLKVDDSPNPLHFGQTFRLGHDGSNYFVQHDIFRLNYG